ncbi:MAG: 3-phosphoshikimate 1-carboxyvinyltransferase [Ruminococcaceae bacterium]|nr:3-phosphoshikimate 1-carboxyvinyltransferase [Oscillospiraceae bacterium]
MSLVKIQNSILSGSVTVPASKSAAHRALICSFLAGGGSVKPIVESNDMHATLGAIDAVKNNKEFCDCIESGSTLRFMIPVAAALGREITFTGSGKLPQRPIGDYLSLLPGHGVKCESEGGLPLKISGQLKSGRYELAGDVSSQYVTGLLLALPILDGDSEIVLTTPLQSKPYVDMTVAVLKSYGVTVDESEKGYFIKGNQKYKVQDFTVEGDWSQAAFFLSAGAIGGDITVCGLDLGSTQGDKEIVNVLKKFGAKITVTDCGVRAEKSELCGVNIDAKDIPDMVPSIAVTAAFAKGKTVISGAERLRFKESDRIESVVTNLRKMGVPVSETPDGMIIEGSRVCGGDLCGYNDHRIVMAFSVAGLFAQGTTTITDSESINKSYPQFFDDYNRLGGMANVISDR